MGHTTIEQSKKLLELGLSPESADCFYTEFGDIIVSKPCENGFEPCVPYTPCWSVGALAKIMEIWYPTFDFDTSNYWVIDLDFITADGDTLIEACYNMVAWLLANGYLKK